MPRRKSGQLLPLEFALLGVVLDHQFRTGEGSYGYQLARNLAEGSESKGLKLAGHGTLYKALGRLADLGLVEHWWEELDGWSGERPRRRMYRVTAAGAVAHAARPEVQTAALPDRVRRPGIVPA